jgi:hypothetical protein
MMTEALTIDFHGRRAGTPRGPLRRPGLDVSITLRPALAGAAVTHGAPSVRVRVHGARGPFRLYLYVDGELAEAWIPADETNEFASATLAGRHTVTARAIDALGRWGGASAITPVA